MAIAIIRCCSASTLPLIPNREALDAYLFHLEEAKRRDHRKLGQELELFMLMEEGPGFPFFLPKGMVLRNELEKLLA